MSPYELNPMNINPLRKVLESSIDFNVLREGCPVKLFLSATNVRTGKVRMFENHEIGPDQVLASGCLPFMFHTVEIEGEAYWDGGYMGNPAIFPLIYGSETNDVVIVHINPLNRNEIPKSAKDIMNRINEISFNSSLIAEMRAINFVRKLLKEGKLDPKEYTYMRMHRVLPPHDIEEMNAASKMNASWDFFQALHTIGRAQMDVWLKEYKTSIGKHSTLDIQEDFLNKHSTKEREKA
jgi:NTE family protein